jgi:hypothetical protein
MRQAYKGPFRGFPMAWHESFEKYGKAIITASGLSGIAFGIIATAKSH